MAAQRTQIYLTREQRERIDELTERDGRALAEVIRDAVDDYLERAHPDLGSALGRTFGVAAGFAAPARAEWGGRDERLWDDRDAG